MEPLTKEQHDIVFDWIDSHFFPQERINPHSYTSTLRTICEEHVGFYMDPKVFHEVMVECGFKSKPCGEYNWRYNVSYKSPVIEEYFYHH